MDLNNQNINISVSNDAFGAGKGFSKLVDALEKGVGIVYRDVIGSKLESKNLKILSAAQAEAEHDLVIKRTETLLEADDLAKRAGKRLIVKEIRRQNNIEHVVSLTAPQLEGDVSDEPVSQDWATRFFENVQDVSDDEAQKIWSKILAGEIKKPGSFSLRTLDVLRNVDFNEAKIFAEAVCPLVVGGEIIIKVNNESNLAKFGLNYGAILKMRDAGFITDGDSIVRQLRSMKGRPFVIDFKYRQTLLKGNAEEFDLPIYILTDVGKELYKIQNFSSHFEYTEAVIQYLKGNGFIDPSELAKDEEKVRV